MRRLVIFIIIILVAVGVLAWRLTRPKTSEFKTAEVKRASITKSVSASGKVASEEEAELKFQTSGQLAWVGVREGDSVSAGQAIAQLDTRELQKDLQKALRDYSKERNDFEEDRNITYKDRAMTDTIKRILEKNGWDLDKAVLDVEISDIALKLATLVTPISGIVTRVDMPVAGVNITPATAVFKVANPDKMIFKANIDEADIKGITASLSAQITLDAFPDEEFTGRVNKVLFSSVTTSGGGTAYPSELSLPLNENLKFKVGMNGDAEIILAKKDNVLVIPSEAVFTKDGQSFVWLVKNGKAVKQEIKIGLVNDENSEVFQGLQEKDRMVVSPISKIKEGQSIP